MAATTSTWRSSRPARSLPVCRTSSKMRSAPMALATTIRIIGYMIRRPPGAVAAGYQQSIHFGSVLHLPARHKLAVRGARLRIPQMPRCRYDRFPTPRTRRPPSQDRVRRPRRKARHGCGVLASEKLHSALAIRVGRPWCSCQDVVG